MNRQCLIQQVIESNKCYTSDVCAKAVYEALEQSELIYKKMIDINKSINTLYCDIEVKKKELKELQKACKHQLTTYHPDPSGNNDSWYECDICQSNNC